MKNNELLEDIILRVAVLAIVACCALIGSLMGYLLNTNAL